mmetsp:Transcript_28244/g.34889  ORF Transcript_28244/g.34889 Transcript_28244/m.34889 type:complete len:108 (+) Transcript_28244:1397-1720(+)
MSYALHSIVKNKLEVFKGYVSFNNTMLVVAEGANPDISRFSGKLISFAKIDKRINNVTEAVAPRVAKHMGSSSNVTTSKGFKAVYISGPGPTVNRAGNINSFLTDES